MLPHEARLQQELLRMTDAWTDVLLERVPPSVPRIICPVSRLVVDVERFPNDADEPMAARGMGAVYNRLSTGEPLRLQDAAHREALMHQWYYPHHAALQSAVDSALKRHGRCLIIDMHSFNSTPLPHEPDQAVGHLRKPRPSGRIGPLRGV
jgi:N-formylglutamate amidohydrolase